jgi:hypothetical protein
MSPDNLRFRQVMRTLELRGVRVYLDDGKLVASILAGTFPADMVAKLRN